jgi:chemotaxis protein methyltransferase CheR
MDQSLETNMMQSELCQIRSLIEERSGMVFDQSRLRFFTNRIREYMQHKGLSHSADVMRKIKSSNADYDELLERVLTQETSFFRYPAIFQALEKRVLPEIQSRKFWSNPRKLTIWSAGCSTGEEPYSIAMTMCEALDGAETWEAKVFATDISRSALAVANSGRYLRRDLGYMGAEYLDKYFERCGGEYVVRPRIRRLVEFLPLNLAQIVYMGRFDCIFCMNVLIYFSEELRSALIRRFADYLEPGGYLFLGHAESVAKASVELEPIVVGDSLIYRKPCYGGAATKQ